MTAVRPLLVLLGPTASGKSALALFLAERLHGEILACDSAQVYRHFDLGTAKPTAAERAVVPHHLLDLCGPSDEFTAGDYLRRGRAALEEISARGRLPIVVAGTGLYLRALLEGLSPLPPRSPELRARLTERAQERGSAWLHRLLARVDSASANEIAPQDTPKLVRALEVFFVARRPRAELFREGRRRLEGYAVEKLGRQPDRPLLYQRIEARVDSMLAAGWLDEARRLRDRFSDAAKPFGFLGYKQLAAHLRGEVSL
ncbi:MAG: tRNA (adenosine(37)-N6)-dimethylallyltransferase MiaA, partial [Candidatus Acidiferrales bacterium]